MFPENAPRRIPTAFRTAPATSGETTQALRCKMQRRLASSPAETGSQSTRVERPSADVRDAPRLLAPLAEYILLSVPGRNGEIRIFWQMFMNPRGAIRPRVASGAPRDGLVSALEYESISVKPQTFPMWVLQTGIFFMS